MKCVVRMPAQCSGALWIESDSFPVDGHDLARQVHQPCCSALIWRETCGHCDMLLPVLQASRSAHAARLRAGGSAGLACWSGVLQRLPCCRQIAPARVFGSSKQYMNIAVSRCSMRRACPVEKLVLQHWHVRLADEHQSMAAGTGWSWRQSSLRWLLAPGCAHTAMKMTIPMRCVETCCISAREGVTLVTLVSSRL